MKYSLCIAVLLMGLGCRSSDPRIVKVEPVTPNGSHISMVKASSFELVLPSEGPSPYPWKLKALKQQGIIELIRKRDGLNEFKDSRSPENYHPHQVFEFKSIHSGKTKLGFYQVNAQGETVVGTERIFEITVN